MITGGATKQFMNRFLIESHKSLQPDTALIIAAGVSRMVDIMEARASSEPAPSGVPLPKLDNFHPSQKDIVVNGLWFFSLALSMLVTLLAMLVKEWANVYRREDRFTPYYVQARTRQARYDGLEDWGAKFVVRSLPVLMHIALGLFLLGLVIFLDKLKLSSVLMQLVLLVVLITLVLYVIMTFVPLFSAFCPFNTPLSNRKAWRFLKSGVYGILRLGVGEDSFTLPGERKERTRSTSTALDKLAAQAVVWLVSYSQAEESVDAGTRAIADANAERGFWNHLTEHEVVTLMAQRFTSFFKGTLDRPWPEDASLNDVISSDDLGRMSLCSRALAKLAKRSTIQLIQATTPHSTISGREEKEPGCIMLPEAYCISVQDGLHRLTESGSAKVAASGFCGASAWHTSTGRTNQNGKGYLLTKLARFLRDKSSELPAKLLADIVETLATETSYMTREQQEDDMNQALRPLIELCLLNPPNGLKLGNGPARKGISTELAVIAALINNYPGTPNMTLTDPNTIGYQYDESYEAYKRRYPYSASSYLAYSRQWRAVWIAEICAKNPKYLEEHLDALLLLGLAGILRSYRMSPSEFTKVVDLFTAELESNRANCSGRMSLPYILAPSCDVQSQIAQDILTAFHNQSFAPSNETEKTKLNLLKCLIQHGQWVEFWPNFFAEILKVLKSSSNKEIQRECILTLDNYWFINTASGFDVYNLPDWELLADFNLIRVLVEVSELGDSRLRSSAISCFSKLARTIIAQIPPQPSTMTTAVTSQPQAGQAAGSQTNIAAGSLLNKSNANPATPLVLLEVFKQLLIHNRELFEIFAKNIACSSSPDIDLAFWRSIIVRLPSQLLAGSGSQPPRANTHSQTAPISTPVAPVSSASSHVPPTGASAAQSNVQAPIPTASGSQPPAAPWNSSQLPAASTSSQTVLDRTPSSQMCATSSGAQALATAADPNAQGPTSDPVHVSHSHRMSQDEAREWLRAFSSSNLGVEGALGEMARALAGALN